MTKSREDSEGRRGLELPTVLGESRWVTGEGGG